MIEETKYKCEFCGETYDNKIDCLECERQHAKPITIKDTYFNRCKKYPIKVYMKMSDGVVCGYELHSIVG